jgi:hypothetical protein
MKKKISILLTIVAMGFMVSAFLIPAENECVIFVELDPLEWEQTVWPLCFDGVTYNWTGGCNVNESGNCVIIDCDTENPNCTEINPT